MDQLYSLYRYEVEKHITNLEKVDDDKRILQTIRDMDHPLVILFKTYRDDPNKRKEILYGKDVKYTEKLKENKDYNWETFEYAVLLPLLRYQQIVPIFKENTGELDSIQITRKMQTSKFKGKLRKAITTVFTAILTLSHDLNENIRCPFHSREVKFNRDNAIALIVGSEHYDEYQYPGYNAIIQRIIICYNNATKKECINWKKWILHDEYPRRLQICSVLNETLRNTSLCNLLGDKEISTKIIKEDREDGRILGGITLIKDVHDDNARDVLKQVKQLRFRDYPFPRNDKCNFIRVASVNDNLPLQYSSESSIFFMLSVKMEPIEKELLQKANEIAFQLYAQTRTQLIQKYGPKHAHELIGKFIPYTSCLWSCQRANDAGYGIHQDSTSLSSENGCHFQEIVVTMIFHINCETDDVVGADLIIYIDDNGKKKKRFTRKTFHNSIHVQDFGNQTNLWHQAGSMDTNAQAGYRLVMTARRTGVDNPEKVMNDMLERKCRRIDPLARKIEQSIHYPTLQEIIDDVDGNLQFGTGYDHNNRPTKRPKKGNPKHTRGKTIAEQDKDETTMIPPLPKLPVTNDNDSPMDSSGDIYGTNHYYSFNESIQVMKKDQSSYIQYGRGHEFLLHRESMKILFKSRICIRTFDKSSKTYVRWAPMVRNRKIVEIGDELKMSWYKDYHNIEKSKIGGHIVSSDHERATGICLLHPERTIDYNDVIAKAVSKNSKGSKESKTSEIHFYGGGGAAKVMGSHPTLISTRLCGAGGMFASNQTVQGTNECLTKLCVSERPVHIALKSRKGDNKVVYLGMFYIEDFHYGYHTPREKFKLGDNCDNVLGASFIDAKTFLFKAVRFDYDDGTDAGDAGDAGDKQKWKEYTIERDSHLSFGVVVSKEESEESDVLKAIDVLRADNRYEYERKTVFESMKSVTDFEKILHPLVDLPIDQIEPNEKDDEMAEESGGEEEEKEKKNDEEELMHSLDVLTINGNDSDEDDEVTY